MELCLNENLIKKWRRIAKRAKDATKRGENFDPTTMLEANFLRNLVEEFLEVWISNFRSSVILFLLLDPA